MRNSLQGSRIKYIGALLTGFLGLGVTTIASATYNSNIVGRVTDLIAYENGSVLFVLDTQPTSNGVCDARYFEIDPTDSSDAVLDRMYKRLLVAYTSGPIQIGYDNSGDCGVLHYIHVYRVG